MNFVSISDRLSGKLVCNFHKLRRLFGSRVGVALFANLFPTFREHFISLHQGEERPDTIGIRLRNVESKFMRDATPNRGSQTWHFFKSQKSQISRIIIERECTLQRLF